MLNLAEITRGTEAILPADELPKRLEAAARGKRRLRVKAGFDPTAKDLHLGHTLLLNKMREIGRASCRERV